MTNCRMKRFFSGVPDRWKISVYMISFQDCLSHGKTYAAEA